MQGAPYVLTAGLALGAGSVALAGAADFTGEWCHPDWGPALFWDKDDIGLGEHRMCDWQAAPDTGATYSTELKCRSIYFDDDKVIETNHTTHRFQAELLSADKLRVRFDNKSPVEMTRCKD